MVPGVQFGAPRASRALALAGLVIVAVVTRSASAQEADRRPLFRTTTSAVTVDVVVRDKAGQPVLGLTENDFEVFEDGVPQRIISVDARSRPIPRQGNHESIEATPLVPRADPSQSIVALVFHQLSHESRAAAIAAARSMVESTARNEYVGVFAVNLSLHMASAFTRDRAALQRALDDVLRMPPVGPPASATGSGVAESAGPDGGILSAPDSVAAAMRQRLEADHESAHRAGVQSASLADVIARLARLPGRKSIVLFSEGLDLSPRLESVVVRALDENVTVYAVHAAGLRGGRGRQFAVRDRSIESSDLTSTSRRGRESWRYGFLEMDGTAGLGPLAKHTGGFLVSDTNDLAGALESINADRHAYYVLAYSSSNAAVDGTTRRIEVRVKRSGVSVRARTGYVAAPPEASTASSPEEERALLALSRVPRPREFEFVARAFKTPKPARPDLVSVLLDVPGGALRFREDRAQKKYYGELSIVTRLSQPSGVVTTQHRLYKLTGDLPRLPAFRQRSLSYFRTMTVPPGSSRLEIVVVDTVGNRTSTTAVPLVSESSDEVNVGDLIIVRDVKDVDAKEATEHPFGLGRAIVMPHLSERIDRTGRDSLLVAIPVVAPRRVAGNLALAGADVPPARVPVSFDTPARDGSVIRFVQLPIRHLPPGRYALTLTIDGLAKPLVRRATFVLPALPK